jgi:hypothetical protein
MKTISAKVAVKCIAMDRFNNLEEVHAYADSHADCIICGLHRSDHSIFCLKHSVEAEKHWGREAVGQQRQQALVDYVNRRMWAICCPICHDKFRIIDDYICSTCRAKYV